jgi:hypothetical protein
VSLTESHRSAGGRRFPPTDRLRVLLLTNEDPDGDQPGFRDAFTGLTTNRSIESCACAAPKLIAVKKGDAGAMRELLEIMRAERTNAVVQMTPQGFPYTEEWFREVKALPDAPRLLYIEQDAWGRWTKPIHPEMGLWWREADVVFTVALGKQRKLIERFGARDVRFTPNTYDQIMFAREETEEPPLTGDLTDVAVIGNWWGNRFLPSRLPGARDRYRLVRKLQQQTDISLAVYGHNWTGRGAMGHTTREQQAAVARTALITANWDHYPGYAAYASNRLATQMLAGRVHVTTQHPQSDWLPGHETGLFLEPTVDSAVRRINELLCRPREEVLALGLATHRWARHRLSDRELARYVLGAVDDRLLESLPADPWARLPS